MHLAPFCFVLSLGLPLTFSAAAVRSEESASPNTPAAVVYRGARTMPDAPSAAELFAARALPEPLIASGGESGEADRRLLLAALRSFEGRTASDDFSALEQYLRENPRSPWCLALLTNLGLLQYRAGYFSRCLPTFLAAWQEGKNATEPKAKALADRAAGEYGQMLARLGRTEDLKQFQSQTRARRFIGRASELMTAAVEGAVLMEKFPDEAFRCGVAALSRILAAQGSPLWASDILVGARATASGMSLLEVKALSDKLGMNYQMAKRAPGAGLIVPSVVHWHVGHFAALIRRAGERYVTDDPTFDGERWHSLAAVEAEASGYFLVPAGALPAGWASVSDTEAKGVLGRGFPPQGRDPEPGPGDSGTPPSPPPRCGDRMASYNFRAMLASLQIADSPVGYSPPYGDAVEFTVMYVQRDPNQPSNFNYSNLGPKWGFNWQRYVIDDPSNANLASRVMAGGAIIHFAYRTATPSEAATSVAVVFLPQLDTREQFQRTAEGVPFITKPDGSKEVYGQSDGSAVAPRKNFLTQSIDPMGNVTTLTYDAQLRVTRITDALGQQTTLSYELAADPYKITKVTDPFGRFATFSYDGTGRLIRIRDVIGIESSFSYEATSDFINAMTTPYGTTTFTSFDNGDYRRVTATDPAGDKEVIQSNNIQTPGIPFNETDAPVITGAPSNFNQWLYFRNSFYWNKKQWKDAPGDYSQAHIYHFLHTADFVHTSRYLESEKDPAQSRIFYLYGNDNAEFVGTQIEPATIGRAVEGGSQIVQRTYNSLGKVTQETDPLGRTTKYTYSADGVDLQSVSQVEGATATARVAAYTYNAQHRPLATTDAAGQTTAYAWNAQGQLTSTTNARNETITYSYHAADVAGRQRKGRLAAVDGPLAGTADTTTFDYDATGNLASVTTPDGYTVVYTYDALDRLTRTTFPDGTYTETTFEALDPKTTRDRLGRTTSYVYNKIRQLISVTDPAGRTTRYQWCKCGDMKELVDALGRITAWRHDTAGRVTAKVYADGSTITYDYEPLSGQLRSITDEKGQVKTLAYNLDGTLASITYAKSEHPTPNVMFAYDSRYRRLTQMMDGIGTTTYAYNPVTSTPAPGAGQLASVDGPWSNDTITYGYDALGRVTSRAIDGVSENTTYDAAGRMATVTNPLGTFTYAYDGATNRLASVMHGGGLKTEYAYLPNAQDRRLQRIRNLKPDGVTPISVFDYTYDAQGRILTWRQQQDDAAATAKLWTLSYDVTDQLTSAVITQGAATLTTYTWQYDLAGNRTKETLNGTATTFGYNPLNELIGSNRSLSTKAYEWDGENRLIAIVDGAARTELSYDGKGRRTRILVRQNDAVVSDKQLVWNDGHIVEQRDSNGGAIRARFFSQGAKIDTTNYLYARDHIRSIREMVDSAGQVVARNDYDPFGKRSILIGNVANDIGFTGFYSGAPDGTPLAVYRAYSPEVGRWISRDPLSEYDSNNLYIYGHNNPIQAIDPFGLAVIQRCEPPPPQSPPPFPPPPELPPCVKKCLSDKYGKLGELEYEFSAQHSLSTLRGVVTEAACWGTKIGLIKAGIPYVSAGLAEYGTPMGILFTVKSTMDYADCREECTRPGGWRNETEGQRWGL